MNPVPPSSHSKRLCRWAGRSLWSVDYEAFATTGMGAWTQLPVPNGDKNSGPFYVVAHRLPFEVIEYPSTLQGK